MRRAVLLALLAAVLLALPAVAGAAATEDELRPPPSRELSDKPRILATGDSMMYVMQFRLFDRIVEAGGVPIVDSRFSTGITKPWILDWHRFSTAQHARYQPDVTVMAIGANDHFPVAGVQCCSRRWQRLYAGQIRDVARTYGRIYWVQLPLPRSKKLQVAFRAVNRAIALARPDVQVINLARVFAPRNVMRRTMTVDGRRITIHQRDGVHLSKPAIAIANAVIVARLQRDGLLPPPPAPVRR